MKIVVLGGGGAMGRVVAMDLVESQDVTAIVIADANMNAAQQIASKLNDKRISVVGVDASTSTNLDSLLKDAVVVTNCLHHDFHIKVMESALRTGTHYLDLGGLYWVTQQQLKLNDEWRKKRLTAVSGIGSSPGTTNVMAAFAVENLVDTVDSVHVRFAAIGLKKTSKRALTFPYHISTVLDEFTIPPPVFLNGEMIYADPLSGDEDIYFPEPIGNAHFMYSIHSELATFPLSFKEKGIKNASFKIALPLVLADKVRFLVDLGFSNKEKILFKGTEISPREFLAAMYNMLPKDDGIPNDFGMIRVYVNGEVKGVKREIIMEMGCGSEIKDWGVGSGALRTGIPPSIVAQMLAKGEITERGVLPAEQCVPTNSFFKELAKRGMLVTSTIKEEQV
jgi:saccharopine dehydrogenase-like NADP-dependent oxidoreductase